MDHKSIAAVAVEKAKRWHLDEVDRESFAYAECSEFLELEGFTYWHFRDGSMAKKIRAAGVCDYMVVRRHDEKRRILQRMAVLRYERNG